MGRYLRDTAYSSEREGGHSKHDGTARRSESESQHPSWTPPRGPLDPSGVLALQRSAGNKATASLIQRMRSLDPPEPVSSPASSWSAEERAPAGDESAEAEADLVASAAIRRWTSSRTTPSGGSPERLVANAVAPELASRQGALDNLRNVTFDASPAAAVQADAMGARGFSEGNRVAFARGELDVSSRSGFELAAHEMTHAALHSPATPTSGGGAGAARLVHAKLRGTAQAAQAMGGTRTTKGARGILAKVGMRAAKTNWDRILDGLKAYEHLEQQVLAKGNPNPKVLTVAKQKLLRTLTRVESDLIAWQQAHEHEELSAGLDEIHARQVAGPYVEPLMPGDRRHKAARRQTVAMLLPRVRAELDAITKDTWASTLGLSDSQVQSKGKEDEGEHNKVQELHYQTERGEFSGYFKADKGFNEKPEEYETAVGIRQWDPNYGARAVAMYRLDQLLEAGVTAKVEFAVHNGKLGTATESAKGAKGTETPLVFRDDGKGQSPGAVSLEDATLQRCLNKLQILDAIAGQLDRHPANYYIQHDQGNVTGVTGIDLDSAFGRDMTRVDRTGAATMAHNFRGLPEQFDEDFATKILSIDERQVTEALKGLLHPSEVEATVTRFRHVQVALTQAQNSGLLVANWNDQTAKTSLGDRPKFAFQRTNYHHDLASGAMATIEAVANPVVAKRIEILTYGEHPKLRKDYTDVLLPANAPSPIAEDLYPLVYAGKVPEAEIEDFVNKVMDKLADDSTWMSAVSLLGQEHEKINWLGHGTTRAVDKAVQAVHAEWKVPANARL